MRIFYKNHSNNTFSFKVFQSQKREHVASTDSPLRPVFYPVNTHIPRDTIRKPDANSEVPDSMKSAIKTCLNCAHTEKPDISTEMSTTKEVPDNSFLKSLNSPHKSESIQVAEISSSDIIEGERKNECKGFDNSLESLKSYGGGNISSESDDLSSMDSISNLKSLIEKVPRPERFQVEAKNSSIYSDEEVNKLFCLSRQKAFYYRDISNQEKLESKRTSNQNLRADNAEEFYGLGDRKNVLCENSEGISGQLTQREKRSINSECVIEKQQHNIHSLSRQNSFCEKSKGNMSLKQKKIDSTADDVKSSIQYTRSTIITETKRKQNSILHPEKANLYTNENLKKTSRRHSITAVSRSSLTPKANLKEPGIAYLGCRIKRDSKSLPGNIFEEPRIVDNAAPRMNNNLKGIKRRHSSITHSNDGACSTAESCAKRRTRSEDCLNPIDENDPVNEKLCAEEAHNRLRWPANNSTLSRSGKRLFVLA